MTEYIPIHELTFCQLCKKPMSTKTERQNIPIFGYCYVCSEKCKDLQTALHVGIREHGDVVSKIRTQFRKQKLTELLDLFSDGKGGYKVPDTFTDERGEDDGLINFVNAVKTKVTYLDPPVYNCW